jgi:hypothetical protein
MAKTKRKRAPGAGRPRFEGKYMTRPVPIRLAVALLDRISAWRKTQADKPAVSTAARRLIENGLERDGF